MNTRPCSNAPETRHSTSRRAFTLVELAIVLVIIGLIVGGVLAGQDLIRAAEMRSVATQYQQFQAGIHAFRGKYGNFPGDIQNATAHWPAADGTTGNTVACLTAASYTATCNGNNDGRLSTISNSTEPYRFWQHLALAGLIAGQYDGVTHGSTGYSATAENTPSSRLKGTLWDAYYVGQLSGVLYAFDGNYGNAFTLGGAIANNRPANPVFRPVEAFQIDSKLDDGMPATGKVMARVLSSGGALATCTNTSSSSNTAAEYLSTASTPTCALFFPQVF